MLQATRQLHRLKTGLERYGASCARQARDSSRRTPSTRTCCRQRAFSAQDCIAGNRRVMRCWRAWPRLRSQDTKLVHVLQASDPRGSVDCQRGHCRIHLQAKATSQNKSYMCHRARIICSSWARQCGKICAPAIMVVGARCDRLAALLHRLQPLLRVLRRVRNGVVTEKPTRSGV